MKAAVLHAKNDLRYEEIKKPVTKPGTVLIKVKYTGICGSDIPRVKGDASHFFPNVLGHEFSGTVEEVGEGVTSVKPGDKVAGVPLVPCMECEDCQKGNYSLCKHYSFIGSRQFGSYSEYVLVPEKNAVKVKDSVTFEMGALFEPATVALHGLFLNDFKGGKDVAILGGGTIGMFMLQLTKAYGAKSVTVFDVLDERLELAKKFGADYVINTSKENFMDETNKNGYDYIFETAGNTITMKMSFTLAANKANVCFVGTPKKEMTFTVKEWENLNRKEMKLTGSWMSYSAPFPGQEWELVSKLFEDGVLKYDSSFIFKKVPLSKANEAFDMFDQPGFVKGKVLLDSEE